MVDTLHTNNLESITKKQKRTIDDMHSDYLCLLPGAMVAIMTAPYLDPNSRVNLIHAKGSLKNHDLCQFYCSKHGTMVPDCDGLCQADVEAKIQHDGRNVDVFHFRLAFRMAKVDPNLWVEPNRLVPRHSTFKLKAYARL